MSEKKAGKVFSDALQKVADKAKNAKAVVQDAAQDVKLPQIKMPELKNLLKRDEPEEKQQEDVHSIEIHSIATKNALMIFYYMIAADGEILSSEAEKFDAIGTELDPDFSEVKDGIIKYCQAQLDKVIDPEDFYDVLQDGVEEALLTSKETADTFITPKLMVWDLLTLIYSDENCSEVERRLLKYIVRKLAIDKAVFLELESSIQTMSDIEKEIEWIKTTDRPYLTIEARINELTKRKNVIFDSVKDLVTL